MQENAQARKTSAKAGHLFPTTYDVNGVLKTELPGFGPGAVALPTCMSVALALFEQGKTITKSTTAMGRKTQVPHARKLLNRGSVAPGSRGTKNA